VRARTDVPLALGVVGTLLMMVVPLPAAVLDVMLAINISLALLTLLVSIYILKPVEFSVFPALLLVLTLFRLALNLATTRRILLHGHEGPHAAGAIIHAFGEFVVGGNFVVGLVVFLILVVIQFVVITKGAGRVAEVAARFTLDAMPGKQMAIDAELNAGLIDESRARARREAISKEADFYGSMDGASKFVRGDAVAGLLTVGINIVGGLLIGVLQQGLDLPRAFATYTLLTVGDGLVTQIPALLVSAASGLALALIGRQDRQLLLGHVEFDADDVPVVPFTAAVNHFSLDRKQGIVQVEFHIHRGTDLDFLIDFHTNAGRGNIESPAQGDRGSLFFSFPADVGGKEQLVYPERTSFLVIHVFSSL
jgi:flagellar biosynthesis protein FlhA